MRQLQSWAWDVAALVGVGLIIAGLWWIYPPISLIIPGIGLVALAIWGACR